MRNKNVPKWVVYTLAFVLLAVMQGTPHALPPIAGTLPLIIVPCAISIAVFEGVTAGAIFGIVGGIIWDIQSGKTFGLHSLLLMVACIAAALLIENLFRNTIFSAFVFSLVTTLVIEFITWFAFMYLKGNEQFAAAFLRIMLPTLAYTNIFIFPLYLGARLIHNKLPDKDKEL